MNCHLTINLAEVVVNSDLLINQWLSWMYENPSMVGPMNNTKKYNETHK